MLKSKSYVRIYTHTFVRMKHTHTFASLFLLEPKILELPKKYINGIFSNNQIWENAICRILEYSLITAQKMKFSIKEPYYLWFSSHFLPKFTVLELKWAQKSDFFCHLNFLTKPLQLSDVRTEKAMSATNLGLVIFVYAMIYYIICKTVP